MSDTCLTLLIGDEGDASVVTVAIVISAEYCVTRLG